MRSCPGPTRSAPRPAALATEAALLGHCRTLLGISRGGERVIARQVPAPQIFGDLQSMPHAEVTSQGLAFEAAFEADHMVALHRSPDRYGRRSCRLRLDRLAELPDRLLHRGDQSRQLIRGEVMIADIAGNDFGHRAEIDGRPLVFAVHDCFSPCRLVYGSSVYSKRQPMETTLYCAITGAGSFRIDRISLRAWLKMKCVFTTGYRHLREGGVEGQRAGGLPCIRHQQR